MDDVQSLLKKPFPFPRSFGLFRSPPKASQINNIVFLRYILPIDQFSHLLYPAFMVIAVSDRSVMCTFGTAPAWEPNDFAPRVTRHEYGFKIENIDI
jgi:hypothetical protein